MYGRVCVVLFVCECECACVGAGDYGDGVRSEERWRHLSDEDHGNIITSSVGFESLLDLIHRSFCKDRVWSWCFEGINV